MTAQAMELDGENGASDDEDGDVPDQLNVE